MHNEPTGINRVPVPERAIIHLTTGVHIMNKDDIQEQIFDLRNEQSNCTPDERAEIQEQIESLYAELDN